MSAAVAELERVLDELEALGQTEAELISRRDLEKLPGITARRADLAGRVAELMATTVLEDDQRSACERRVERIVREASDHLALLCSARDELGEEIRSLVDARRALDRYAAVRRS